MKKNIVNWNELAERYRTVATRTAGRARVEAEQAAAYCDAMVMRRMLEAVPCAKS